MKNYYTFLIFIALSLLSCSNSNQLIDFEKEYDKLSYQKIANAKGITNSVWIDRMYSYKVNINKFDEFKSNGIDLTQFYGNDYKSRVLLSDAIVEGEIISEKENPSGEVMFHTEYQVKVKEVIKPSDQLMADTIILKVIYGPVGDLYMAVIAGNDRYKVGEHAIIYLENMERTFKSYEEKSSERLSRINADRSDPNIFQPLKKYLLKNDFIHDRTYGKIEKKNKAIKEIKKIVKINTAN